MSVERVQSLQQHVDEALCLALTKFKHKMDWLSDEPETAEGEVREIYDEAHDSIENALQLLREDDFFGAEAFLGDAMAYESELGPIAILEPAHQAMGRLLRAKNRQSSRTGAAR